MDDLEFERDGLEVYRAAYDLAGVEALRALPANKPGVRLQNDRLEALLAPITQIARERLGIGAQPVRAVLFDKTAAANWSLGWHQDRTVVVRQRIEVDGFGPWSRKNGAIHVAPPIELLQRMATFRIHLDACGPRNAPLRVAAGSHGYGFVEAHAAQTQAERGPIVECLAAAGDVWAYRTPILHASARAVEPSRRRVLQVDYSADDLPGGLEWRGLGESQ